MARPGYWTPGPSVSESERDRRRRFWQFMSVYWSSRQAYEGLREQVTAMYDWEVEQFEEEHPPVLFKDYLIASRGQPR